jgi:hypothetical protein
VISLGLLLRNEEEWGGKKWDERLLIVFQSKARSISLTKKRAPRSFKGRVRQQAAILLYQ